MTGTTRHTIPCLAVILTTVLLLVNTGCVSDPVVAEPEPDNPAASVEWTVVTDSAFFDSSLVRPVFLLFVDPTDSLCNQTIAVVNELAAGSDGAIVFGRVDVHASPGITTDLSVSGVPAVRVVTNGIVSGRISADELNHDRYDVLERTLGALSGRVMVSHLTPTTFDSAVVQPGVTALVDFFSPSCGYCREMDPVIDSLAQLFPDNCLVAKVNIIEFPSLRDEWEIRLYPTFIIFRDGSVARRITGKVPLETLRQAVTESIHNQK